MKVIPRDTYHVEHPFQKKTLEKLWEPITIAGVTSKNKIAFAPVNSYNPEFSYPDMPETAIFIHEAIAKGGTGIIAVGEADVTLNSPSTLEGSLGRYTKGIWSDDAIPDWAKLIDACHKWGAKVFPQLSSHAPWITGVTRVQDKIVSPSWKETGMTPEAIEEEKNNFVAGGGDSGMEAAGALALRGHKVMLCEKEEELGRMLRVQSHAPFRTDMDLARKYLSTQVGKLGVDVRCNQEVTAALVEKEKPDTVIVATGCRPKLPEIPGIDRPNVVFAEDVLLENVDVGKRVVVIDADVGHDLASLGSFTAQFVARSGCLRDDIATYLARWSPQHTPEQVMAMSNTPVGKEVTIVTRRGRIADVHWHHFTTSADLRRLGVTVIVGCEYKEINDKGLVIIRGRQEELLEADTIITANYETSDELYKELEGKVPELHLIGDAKAVQLQLVAIVHEAYRLAMTV